MDMYTMQQYMNIQLLQGMRPLIDGSLTAPNSTAVEFILPEIFSSLSLPPEVRSFISQLSSFSTLRDWLIIAAIGWVFDFCRWAFGWMRFNFWRIRTAVRAKIMDSVYLEVEFETSEPCHKWMLVWLSKQPGWANARKIRFSREAISVSSSALGPYKREDNDIIRDLRFVPKACFTYSCWFKRHYLTVGRAAPTSDASYYDDYNGGYRTPVPFYGRVGGGTTGANLFISIVAWDTSIILDLLREAQKAYAATLIRGTNVYTSAFNNNVHWGSNDCGQWKLSSTTPKRSFDSIVLDPAIKDLLLQDAISFLSNRAWYSERCIPFRRGYLLYGPPGSGKTSFISAIAGELGLDVYIISLSQAGMDDAGLARLFNDLPGNCIALIEDIDAAFTRNVNRDAVGNNLPGTMIGWPVPDRHLGVSLSGLLNALDGIGAQEGRILFATTNKYESLDKALSRPGRMDLHVEFKLAAKYQAEELFKRFYNPRGTDLAEDDKENSTPVVRVPSCVTVMDKLHTNRAPRLRLSQSRLQELADAFAEAIPEHEFSMASIQGYLMAYKTDPVAAAAGIKAWVHETRSDKTDLVCDEGMPLTGA